MTVFTLTFYIAI